MATSYDVNLTIGSALGFTQVAGAFVGYYPKIETTKDFESNTTSTIVGFDNEIRLLRVTPSPLDAFDMVPGVISNPILVDMTNDGTAELTITGIRFTQRYGVYPLFDFDYPSVAVASTVTLAGVPPVFQNSGTITIQPGNTSTFALYYYGPESGNFANAIAIYSNSNAGTYKFDTYQSIIGQNSFEVSEDNFEVTLTAPGQVSRNISLTPVVNFVSQPNLNWEATAQLIEPSSGWSVIGNNINSIDVQFKSNYVSNINGIYTATFVINSENTDVSKYVTGTAIVDIDYSGFKNFNSWVSPAAPNNSVIGISYDLIDNRRYITIGVGMGADGTPEYSSGGSPFLDIDALGYLGATIDYPYFAWSTVYKFEIPDNQAVQYLSGEQDSDGVYLYRVKPGRTQDGTYLETDIEYEQYFGSESSPGSMFIVSSDQYGNVSIALNQLRSLSGDEDVDRTLKNLTRAFYYYSNVDDPSRYYQLSPSPIQDGTVTYRFAGFNNSGTVLTSVVPLPTGF